MEVLSGPFLVRLHLLAKDRCALDGSLSGVIAPSRLS
jgi:hypothetical protein